MLREFKRANTVIHTVDISGLRADSREEDRVRVVGRDALFYLANDTGGRLHEDANDFGAELQEVLESSTVTYLLSFQPTDPGEAGDHHRLRVRARAPKGAQLSHRMGYYTPRPYGDLHPMEKRLLASDLIAAAAERDDLSMDVLAAAFRAGPDQAYIPVIVEIDGGTLLEGHESPRLPVEIYAYITDDKSEMRDFFSRVVTLDLTGRQDTFANTGLKYYGSLDLAPGDYLLRVLARNAVTGATGVETLALHVPTFEDGEPTLLPPFFHEEPGAWFLIREQPADQYARTTVYPFHGKRRALRALGGTPPLRKRQRRSGDLPRGLQPGRRQPLSPGDGARRGRRTGRGRRAQPARTDRYGDSRPRQAGRGLRSGRSAGGRLHSEGHGDRSGDPDSTLQLDPA